jgi:capsular polysaccharide biosynthesis protein
MFQIVLNNFFASSSSKRAFVVTFVFVAFASALFWLDFFRSYRAEITVLIISKTEMSSQEVAENMAEVTQTLSFYERVLSDNDLIDDDFEGYAPDKRKALWNYVISVKRQANSGALTLETKGDTPEKVKRLAKQTAQTLFSVAGLYYNVKTDIDMRIIDWPIVSYKLARPFLFGVTSILTGLVITSLFFFVLNAISQFTSRQKTGVEKMQEKFAIGETVPWIDPRKFIPSKPKELSFENVSKESRSPQYTAHAPAPSNLPVAPEEIELPTADEQEISFEFETPSQEFEEMFSPEQGEPLGFPVRGEHSIEQPRREEPTSEEYKRRLNELLSGGK